MNVKNRRGISPLIATLLLIAIAVAASVMVYAWTMTMVQNQAIQAQTSIRIESVAWDVSPANTCTVTVRNTGSVPCIIEGVAVRLNRSGTTYYSDTVNLVLDVGGHGDVAWNLLTSSLDLGPGESYSIRVTTSTGFFAEIIAVTPS